MAECGKRVGRITVPEAASAAAAPAALAARFSGPGSHPSGPLAKPAQWPS